MKLATMEESNARKRNIKPIQKKELTPEEKEKKRIAKNQRQRENRRARIEVIQVQVPKNKHIRELLYKRHTYASVSEYIIAAILEKLERDGIDIHMFDDEQ